LLLSRVLHPCDPLDRFADQARGHGPLTDLSPLVASLHGKIEDPFPVGLVAQGEVPPLLVVGHEAGVHHEREATYPSGMIFSFGTSG
jgi:hypothetical protein